MQFILDNNPKYKHNPRVPRLIERGSMLHTSMLEADL